MCLYYANMKNEINKIFSKIVKKLRKEIYDWSQQILADNVDCDIKTIQRIEGALDNGNYKPSKDMILKIFYTYACKQSADRLHV